MNSIELKNVAPISQLTIPIPEKGGVVVLRGANGSGKSHALQAVEGLYDKNVRKTLRNTDGTQSGSVKGMGVTLRLGRVNTSKGELLCEAIDGRVDPSQLVDPGIKDPVAADARRLATLVRLANVKVSAAQWAEMLGKYGSEIELESLVDDDPVTTADRMRRKLHAMALSKEKQANSSAQESATLETSVADVNINGQDNAAELMEELEQVNVQIATGKQQRMSIRAAIEQQSQAMQQLETLEASAMDPDACEREWQSYRSEIERLTLEEVELQNRLNAIRKDVEKNQALQLKAMERKVEAEEQRKQIELLKVVVSKTIEEPVELEVIEGWEARREKIREDLKLCEVIKRAKQAIHKAKVLAAHSQELNDEAETIRDLARSTDSVLENALQDAGFTVIKVHDGRLCVETDRGIEPYSELSHGERWRIALDLTACGLGVGAVVPVRQEGWEALDPKNKHEIQRMALDRSLVMVTAEAADGELRAELFDDEGEVDAGSE